MDDCRFDHLVRTLAAPATRRTVIGTIAAGALSIATFRQASARSCAQGGRICREHADCCSGSCGSAGATGRRACLFLETFFVSAFAGADLIGLQTGLIAQPGKPLTISATDAGANCNISDNPPNCVDGPNGKPTDFGGNALAPAINLFALIARIGAGPWIKIGVGPTVINGSGQLYLAYNDLTSAYGDNGGGFNVSILHA